MFDLLKSDVAVVLALAWLLMGLFLPVIAFWFLYRVARDLRRIADAQEFRYKYPATAKGLEETRERKHYEEAERRVANSAFGR
jgi:hypothetical protein